MNNVNINKGRLVLFSATGISFISGVLYIWSIISKALMEEYHWSSTESLLPYTVATIVFALSMCFAGGLQDKKGPRLCGTFGGLLLGIGLILKGFPNLIQQDRKALSDGGLQPNWTFKNRS